MTADLAWHIGKQIARQRRRMGMTQQDLAERVGVTFQSIGKYEAGQNTVSAERLWDITLALYVPVSYFYEGLPVEIAA